MQFKEFRTFARPVAISAFSLFSLSIILNSLIVLIDPTYHLLSNRGVGKVLFTLIAVAHVLLLMQQSSQKAFRLFLDRTLYFLTKNSWIRSFLKYFILFFLLHTLILLCVSLTGYAVINSLSLNFIASKWQTLTVGFVATFFLAWTEELIFRGALFTYCQTLFTPLTSALITSILFSLAHNLSNPIILITQEWQLGLGLFLLGLFLNLIFIITEKLYIGMGIHAGLVFVKVILRRLPFITFLPADQLPWFIAIDLRKSPITHVLLLAGIVILIYQLQRKVTFKKIPTVKK